MRYFKRLIPQEAALLDDILTFCKSLRLLYSIRVLPVDVLDGVLNDLVLLLLLSLVLAPCYESLAVLLDDNEVHSQDYDGVECEERNDTAYK